MNRKISFFAYFGGKYRLAAKLIAMFPEHTCYVEVFGGAGNVLLQKTPSPVEIFNDINSDVVNLFRQVRDNFEAFYEKVSLVPHSREERFHFRDCLKTETDPLERAVMFYTHLNQSFSGLHRGWSFSKVHNTAKGLKRKVEKLPHILERLREVTFENESFEYILQRYDSTDTFFYCDPPYPLHTRTESKQGYADEMKDRDHQRLFEILPTLNGKVMLSGYQNTIYERLAWREVTFETKQSASRSSNHARERTEVVYMNW